MTAKSGAVRSFEDLEVFQRAYRLSLDVHRRSLGFPASEQRALADQVRRASKSVCANIAEGFGKQRQSVAEFRRFLMMAMGSADESGCGAAIVLTSVISRARLGSIGGKSTGRLPACCKGCTRNPADVLIPDPCLLASDVVAERSVSLRRDIREGSWRYRK